MAATVPETDRRPIGAAVKRVEDPRLITGAARYLDDLKLPGMALRRHPALAVRARAHRRHRHQPGRGGSPGVVGVFTGRDFAAPEPAAVRLAGRAASTNNVVTPRALEIDKVAFTGAGVAAVVAETREAAEDALELIDVDWEPLDAVVDAEAAVADGRAADPRERRRATSSWTGRAATPTRPTRRSARPTSSSSSGSSTSG